MEMHEGRTARGCSALYSSENPMAISGRIFVIAAMLTALLVTACSKDGKKPVQSAPESGLQAVQGRSVSILPALPTVQADLQAMVSGGGGTVAYQWKRNDHVIEEETNAVLPRTKFVKGDVITVRAVIEGTAVETSVTIRNSPPQVTSVSFNNQNLHRGVDLTLVPVSSDADGDAVQYQYKWMVNDKELPENGPTLRGDQFKRGDRVSFAITPSDYEGAGPVYAPLPIVIPDAPPRFLSTPATTFQGNTYAYQAVADDPDGDVVTYALKSAPEGMKIDSSNGAITWTFDRDQAGTHAFEVVARDGEGLETFQKVTLVITIP